MGTTEGARRRFRGGREWPDSCQGPGKYQHKKGCHPRRPRCRWRKKKHEHWQTCECGIPHFIHRRGSIYWKSGACVHHPESDRINFEMSSLQDWETGEPLDPSDINPERYE